MNRTRTVRLMVEQLEDRWVPATVKFFNANLITSNPFIVNGQAKVQITATGTNSVTVNDAGLVTLSYGTVNNIYFLGSNAKDKFTYDANGNVFTGDLFVSSGNGNDSVLVTNTSGT